MAVTINGTTGIAGVDGSASTPAVQGTDTNTGIFYPAADTIAFAEGGAEAMRIDSSGNVGIGTTSPTTRLHVSNGSNYANLRVGSAVLAGRDNNNDSYFYANSTTAEKYLVSEAASVLYQNNGNLVFMNAASGTAGNTITFTERARITSGGALLVGTTTTSTAGGPILTSAGGFSLNAGYACLAANTRLFDLNRVGDDGVLVAFWQAGTEEGNISVSGTTVSYNGGHLSRWAQTQGPKDDTLLKGTVLSNLDEMNVYTDAEGNPVDNEQLNKVKVSNVEGDVNVAGVFVNWSYDEAHQVDEINMAMTGDMIIRIAQGVVVQKGDLLMSAGDGTAKPQGDDIVRSKTVAKVTSNHVTCTYEDGSYCVPCVLMAC